MRATRWCCSCLRPRMQHHPRPQCQCSRQRTKTRHRGQLGALYIRQRDLSAYVGVGMAAPPRMPHRECCMRLSFSNGGALLAFSSQSRRFQYPGHVTRWLRVPVLGHQTCCGKPDKKTRTDLCKPRSWSRHLFNSLSLTLRLCFICNSLRNLAIDSQRQRATLNPRQTPITSEPGVNTSTGTTS